MLSNPSAAPAPRDTQATAARCQWTGVDALLPARMQAAVARRTLVSPASVMVAGQAVIVTYLGCPVRLPLAKEAFRLTSCVITEGTV